MKETLGWIKPEHAECVSKILSVGIQARLVSSTRHRAPFRHKRPEDYANALALVSINICRCLKTDRLPAFAVVGFA